MSPPLLTIIVANYNNGHFLEASVNSILENRQRPEVEVLIIDDQSTDGSLEIIQKLSKNASVHYFQRSENGGVEAAFNTGVALAKGEYLHFFGADDLYLPGTLSKMLSVIRRFPDIHLFSSDFASFLEPGQVQTKQLLPLFAYRYFSSHETYKLLAHTRFWIPGQTVFIKKATCMNFYPQDLNLQSAADWYINTKIALQHGVFYLPKTLIARREDPTSYSSNISLENKRAIWLYLLSLFEKNSDTKKLYQSGHARILGLRSIYKDLLKTPRYWKFLFPIMRKMIEIRGLELLNIDPAKLWLRLFRPKGS